MKFLSIFIVLFLFVGLGCGSDSGDNNEGDEDKLTCPENFIKVPANSNLGVEKDFCIAKYEMKIKDQNDGDQVYSSNYMAESRASGTPWKNLNMEQAKAECEEMGEGFHLVTNREWITIAHNIESVGDNWSDGVPHITGETDAKINIGQTCRAPNLCRANPSGETFSFFGEALEASENDQEGCYGLQNFTMPEDATGLNETQLRYYIGLFGNLEIPNINCDDEWSLHRRTHYLSNGEIIWDFSGNVWNWVDYTVEEGRARKEGADPLTDQDWVEVNLAVSTDQMSSKEYRSLNQNLINGEISKAGDSDQQLEMFNNSNTIGRIHPCPENGDSGTVMRGGNYMHGYDNAGIYSIGMGYSPDTDHLICQVGFRCAYSK